MELRVAGNEVLLSLHRTYCAEDDSAVLQAVSKFKPLMDYLTKLNTDGFALSTLLVRNVQYVAQRIVQVHLDALFQAKGALDTITDSITLSDESLAVYLPVVVCSGVKYGVLVAEPLVAIGGQSIAHALCGVQSKPGAFTSAHNELLSSNGFAVDGLTSMSANELVVGHEGLAPSKFLTSTRVVTEDELAALQSLAAVGGVSLVIQAVEDIVTNSQDLKATVAAALTLSSL